ncbi:aminotransferase class I/II-fold pyridoxal phosphate-dependent enzyme [Flavobacterium sp. SUN046]|uniref:pyridoxal phosphate-dependent aminotransferase n=1 Tax=Flavobacterium sp. SUN046 TaxID=3002440 RepID=UPI002DBE7CD0|nr:aminotransferase class I/II-fold pyridoxal phosphate-dependent enzyme [Flavobacterium sp. SUN046]MEC4049241.1 aminotransferase class I/II-fold pyridoxal phosphate-dependent enzyme [Flavobacterium sp. SUN046]
MVVPANRLDQIQEYYFSSKLREVRQLLSDGNPIINLGIGSPDLAPAPTVIQALLDALSDPKAHQYQSYQGIPELRQGIADFYKRYFEVNLQWESEVLPLMGSKEGIMHIAMAFLNPGDAVLIPNPGYPTYTSVTHLVGATPLYYELKEENQWQPDFEALEAMDLSKTKLMWISYPHMPTGTSTTVGVLEQLIGFAKKHNILLVNDNPYSFILNQEPLSILKINGANEVAMELNSLSKTYNLAGWRVGMLCGKKEFIEEVLKVKSNMDSGMFFGIQKGAVAALALNSDWFEAQNMIYQERKELVHKLASKLGLTFDPKSVGLFVWAKLPPHYPSAEAFIDTLLYQKHLFIAPGTIFGSQGEGYVRFSLCVEAAQIQEAINRI